jgi:hypothetical protein
MDIRLEQGDVFATKNPQSLGKVITFMEMLRCESKSAEYSHAGIIQDAMGKTLEAVWHIEEQNIFEAYKGDKVIIARWNGMTPETYQKGWDSVKGEIGEIYPYSRLLLHFLGLARWIHLGNDTVCSELAEKFLINAGYTMGLAGKNWWGLTPEELVDEWRISKYFNIVFEGEI